MIRYVHLTLFFTHKKNVGTCTSITCSVLMALILYYDYLLISLTVMNLIGFNDSEIHTHTKKSWKNGHKLKMSLSMVNKEKDIHLFDIFIEKHSIAPDKTMAWQNSLRINETQEEWVVCP